MTLDLSIIIPAYNEEKRLPKTIASIRTYLSLRRYPSEVLVVDDGSSDNTAKIVQEARNSFPQLRLLSNGRNRGKGFSVRHGMLEARGEVALFTDADLSTPIGEADKLLAAIFDSRYDAAIGSRLLRNMIEVHQSKLRETAGKVFNLLVRGIAGIDFGDTQCGFKAFRRIPARILFEQQQTDGFGFDPEILFLARRHGLKVTEIPVRWAHDPGTKVRVFSDSLRMFGDLIRIRLNNRRGIYPKRAGFRPAHRQPDSLTIWDVHLDRLKSETITRR
ncbi:MAG TPA: dolichyl-phosphate beta-glucosyltransferase [Terriglobales bacterium]|jgi:glycosyltransferase involved in cell wall biosynthesis|nr:dolichyl-phosphate beta-glucosyltransferase [Terriglobales bacterium]